VPSVASLRQKMRRMQQQLAKKNKVIKNLRKERNDLRKRCCELEKLAPSSGDFGQNISVQQRQFFSSQQKAALVSAKGMRWSPAVKLHALNVYFKSPAAYRVQAEMFRLPHKDTLLRPFRSIFLQVWFYC